MPELINDPDTELPLSRPYEVDTLPANRLIKFNLVPTMLEINAVKSLLGLTGLKKLTFDGEISPLGARAWQLDAKLGATVSQICVVTAEPVRTRIDVNVRVKYLPENQMPADTVETELDEELEPLGKTIDIGVAATQALALEIPLYPRKEGAELQNSTAAPLGEAPLSDADVKPFAGLAALKDKLEPKAE